ncbi:MAG: flavodoxin domain-containing protein [Planctomycetota bacterium]
MRAIILYATREGQTAKIADRISRTLADCGVPADTFDVSRYDATNLAVESYQAVVLGSSLHQGQYDSKISSCIDRYRSLLSRIPTAYYSVSLGIISKRSQDECEAHQIAIRYLREHHFAPSRTAHFAGALRYSKYGWLTRHLMRSIAKNSGYETSMDQDYEYTQWDLVDEFARDFARFVHRCRQPRPRCRPNHGVPPKYQEYSVRNAGSKSSDA